MNDDDDTIGVDDDDNDNDASSKNYEWQFLVKDAIDDIDMKKQKCLQGKTFNH